MLRGATSCGQVGEHVVGGQDITCSKLVEGALELGDQRGVTEDSSVSSIES